MNGARGLRTRRLPPWIRSRPLTTGKASETRRLLAELGLQTICTSARCPNIGECYGRGTATFLLLGDICTRGCAFCGVQSGTPAAPSPDEPERVAKAVRALGLAHAVVTSVTRDDLADGGAAHFARTVDAIRRMNPRCTVELLVPDFGGGDQPLAAILRSAPDVFGHNVETVRRLHQDIRPGASYERSLQLLQRAKLLLPTAVIKSAFMLGLGETEHETEETLQDLSAVGCQIVCVGQYLRPSRHNPPVCRYPSPEEFGRLRTFGEACGIPVVLADPLVRSSYRAAEAYGRIVDR